MNGAVPGPERKWKNVLLGLVSEGLCDEETFKLKLEGGKTSQAENQGLTLILHRKCKGPQE